MPTASVAGLYQDDGTLRMVGRSTSLTSAQSHDLATVLTSADEHHPWPDRRRRDQRHPTPSPADPQTDLGTVVRRSRTSEHAPSASHLGQVLAQAFDCSGGII